MAQVIAPLGLRLAEAKSRVCHIDEGFDFLGFRIQRRTKQGTSKKYVYTYPSKKALAAIKDKVRAITHKSDRALALLLRHLNLVLRGWCNYFRHGVSAATFQYLDYFVWCRVTRWLRKRHPQANWKELRRRFLTGTPGQRPAEDGIMLFLAGQVPVTRYRWRAYSIPAPWASIATEPAS